MSIVSKVRQSRPQLLRARQERSLLGGSHEDERTRFGAVEQAVAISSLSAMRPPNPFQQFGESDITRRRLGPKLIG
jgi:hypothetical protein